nr:hypothetical protein Q903MT_gene1171 [Picea sitchensis]QHR92062.1 hypothetical protein Q903MT_gene6098 [Picea sitchensis]
MMHDVFCLMPNVCMMALSCSYDAARLLAVIMYDARCVSFYHNSRN